MRTWFVIPAAGSGRRLGGNRPKQYQLLAGKPLLQHTLDRLDAVPEIAGGVIALAATDPYWPEIRSPYTWPLQTCVGGVERNDSVRAALEHLSGYADAGANDWVLVHDAARPLVRLKDIANLRAQVAAAGSGGILALPVADTLKRASADAAKGGSAEQRIVETVDRSLLWRALTPQMFPLHFLLEALRAAQVDGVVVTDEAQAVERQGMRPLLVQGATDNLKVTHPEDWALAEHILRSQLG